MSFKRGDSLHAPQLLKIAAILTFTAALFQAAISASPEWSLYFGAGEQITSKPWLLYLTGFGVAAIFALFGFYALSGAGSIGYMPLLRSGLLIICGLLYLLGFIGCRKILPKKEGEK